jgi:hypothetical protein
MDDAEGSDRRGMRKREVPPGWLSGSAAVQHVAAARGVSEQEAESLLLQAVAQGWVRADFSRLDALSGTMQVLRFSFRILLGRFFGADLWQQFPPRPRASEKRRHRLPMAEEAISAAIEWLDYEGEQQRAAVERWIAGWLTSRGHEQPAESTIRRWAADASERLQQRRALFEDRSSRGR